MSDANRRTSTALAFHAATKYVPTRDSSGQIDILTGTPPTLESAIWQEDVSIEPRAY
jgi:hypothetical protein